MTRDQVKPIYKGLKLSREQFAKESGFTVERILDLEKPGGDRFLRQEQDALRSFFGKKFRVVRAQEGLSLQQLAQRVNLTASTVKDWEDDAPA